MAQIPRIDQVSVDDQLNPNTLLPLEIPILDPSRCPKTHHLIITTAKGVYSWSRHGITELFRSGSQGIVAAQRAPDGSGLLAVADSGVVFLRDVKKGTERNYRLKGSDGQVRLLKYANDARTLFLMTSLQDSVQTYSPRQFRLLEPLQTHPSPPTVLALSSTSHLLLSASVEPPTIHLTNLTLRTPPISLHPSCSSSAVVAASFHPERANVFLLAFADGVLAIYDAVHVFGNGGKGERKEGPAGTPKGGELGHIKGLQVAGGTSTISDPDALQEAATFGDYAESTQTGAVGSSSRGITAVSFLPGYPARAISAGADGKCHLIDFEAHNRKVSRIVRSWHVRGPATSMSVIPFKGRGSTTPKGRIASGREETSGNANNGSLIVVGRLDGKVCLFGDSGILRGEMVVDPARGPILDVEWMEGPGDKVSKPSGGRRAESQPSNPIPRPLSHGSRRTGTVEGKRNSLVISKRKSLGSLMAAGRQIKEEVLTLEGEEPKGGDYAWRDTADVYAAKYMDMFSPVKQHVNNESLGASNPSKQKSKPPDTSLEHLSAVELQFPLLGLEIEKPISNLTRRESRTAVRPRPGPRRGSQAAIRTSHTARRGCQGEGRVVADVRRAVVPGRPARGCALFAPYIDRKVMMDGTKAVKLDPSSTQVSTTSRVKTRAQRGEDGWIDVYGSPPIPGRTYSQKAATDVSKKNGCKSISFQPSSDMGGEDGTIIQGQPQSTSSISKPLSNLPQANTRHNHVKQRKSSKETIIHRLPKEESVYDFKIHEDPAQLSETGHSTQRIRTTTDAETVATTPLGSRNYNIVSTNSSHDPSITLGSAKEHAKPQDDTAALFNEKLQEVQAALADDMRDFQAEIVRQFEEHRKQIEETLARESIARQKVVEENRLLREELAETNRRR